jgi:hypothetical protein
MASSPMIELIRHFDSVNSRERPSAKGDRTLIDSVKKGLRPGINMFTNRKQIS